MGDERWFEGEPEKPDLSRKRQQEDLPVVPSDPAFEKELSDFIQGGVLTRKYAKEILGEEKGEQLWQGIEKVKKNFNEKFPNETFPPVFVAEAWNLQEVAGYGNDPLGKKDANGKMDTTDRKEALILGRQFMEENSIDSLISVIYHELGHDIENHPNRIADALNRGAALSLSEQRQQECEADMVGVMLQGQTRSAIETLTRLTGGSDEWNRIDPQTYTHPSGEDRVRALKAFGDELPSNIGRIHLNEHCEQIGSPASTPLPVRSKRVSQGIH